MMLIIVTPVLKRRAFNGRHYEGKERTKSNAHFPRTLWACLSLRPFSIFAMRRSNRVQMGSNVVELNIRHILVKSQDEVIAVGKKGINVFVSVHNFSLLVKRSVRH